MKRMINVALPKGRLGEKAYSLFARAGYECPELLKKTASSRLKMKRRACAISG